MTWTLSAILIFLSVQVIKDISERLQQKRSDILFLKNYESEYDLETEKNVLILSALKVK